MFSRAVRWLVLRRRATASGRARIESDRVALAHFGEVGPDVIEINDRLLARRARRFNLGLLDEGQRMALEHRVTRRDRNRRTIPLCARVDYVLHLHRFHDEQLLALANLRRLRATAIEMIVPCIGAMTAIVLSGRDDRRQGAEHDCEVVVHAAAAARLAVGEHRQRIGRIDLRTGQTRAAAGDCSK